MCMQGVKVDRVQASGRKSGGSNRLYVPWKACLWGKEHTKRREELHGRAEKRRERGYGKVILNPVSLYDYNKINFLNTEKVEVHEVKWLSKAHRSDSPTGYPVPESTVVDG